MYKIIMIDDEDIVLNTIPQAIDWNAYGLELVATFNDAEAALEYIDTHAVDGVFTDIQMPVISGLELSEYIHKNRPNIVVFIISAYSNFEYARTAMEYNVAGYILKPLNFKNLSEACTKMKEKIDNVYAINAVYYVSAPGHPHKLQKLISDYTTKNQMGLLNDISLCLKEHNYDTNISDFPCAIVSVTIMDLPEYLSDTWTHGKENLFVALNQLMVSENLYIFPTHQAFDKIELLIMSKTPSSQLFQNNISEFKNEYTASCFENLNIVISVDTISLYKALGEMNSSYNSNNYGFQKIFNYITSGNDTDAITTFDDVLNICTENILPALNVFLSAELTNHIGLENLNKSGIYPASNRDSGMNYSYDETLAVISNAANHFKTLKAGITTIHDAKQYIDEHYSENISLTFLSELVYMSISQFTRIFKKEFNISFLNYLNQVRIKHACNLLISTDLPSNTVCGMVGYTSYSYFSKKFKQYTGHTIAEYRQNYKNS